MAVDKTFSDFFFPPVFWLRTQNSEKKKKNQFLKKVRTELKEFFSRVALVLGWLVPCGEGCFMAARRAVGEDCMVPVILLARLIIRECFDLGFSFDGKNVESQWNESFSYHPFESATMAMLSYFICGLLKVRDLMSRHNATLKIRHINVYQSQHDQYDRSYAPMSVSPESRTLCAGRCHRKWKLVFCFSSRAVFNAVVHACVFHGNTGT